MKQVKTISKIVVAAGMMALAVACSKGSSNSSPVNPYGYGYGTNGMYQNGAYGAGPLLTNVQFSTGSGGMQGIVNLGGTGGMQVSPYTYQGAVAPYQVSPYGNGIIQVSSGSYCAMPGQYQIVGVSGQYGASASYGIMNGITIQAQGPGGMIAIQAYTAEINFSQNRLAIGTGQLIVNGQSCGSIATY